MKKAMDWFFEGDTTMPWAKVAITTLAVTLPPFVAILFLGRAGAIAFIAALPAHLAAKDEGPLPAALVTVTLGMAGLLSLGAPDMALLVAPVLGLMTGICGHLGLARPCLRALITWTVFTAPILPADDKPLLFAVFLAAMVWALGVTWIFGQSRTTGDEENESEEYALVFGIVLAVGLAASVYVGGRWFGEHGFWFPLTFVVLCIPPHGTLFSRTAKRTIGTVAGTAAAIAIAWVSDATWLVATIGAISLPLAFRFLPRNYTLFTALLTVCVLEVLALVSDVSTLALERLTTMGAAAVMTLALGALGALALWLWRPKALEALQDD